MLEKNNKTRKPAGRPLGSKTKFKLDVISICEHHKVNPAEALVILLKESNDPEFKLKCAAELLPYCAAKLKSVELSQDPSSEFILNIITKIDG